MAKANFSPSLFLSLLYAPFCFFTAVRSFSPVFFWFFYGSAPVLSSGFRSQKSPVFVCVLASFPGLCSVFFLFQSPVLFVFHSFSVSSVLPPVRFPCLVTCLSVFVSGSRPLFFVSFSPLLPLLCSAFYKAQRACPKTSPGFAGLLSLHERDCGQRTWSRLGRLCCRFSSFPVESG